MLKKSNIVGAFLLTFLYVTGMTQVAEAKIIPPFVQTETMIVQDEMIVEFSSQVAGDLIQRMGQNVELMDSTTGVSSLDSLNTKYGVMNIRPILPPQLRESATGSFQDRLSKFFVLKLEQGQDPLKAIQDYRNDPNVVGAQPNFLYTADDCHTPISPLPDDPRYLSGEQWAHQVTHAEPAWGATPTPAGDPSVVIAVIGTGVELQHPDLSSNLVPGWDYTTSPGDSDPSPDPCEGCNHETKVAGVAAAVGDNGIGIAGAAWGCKVMPLRVGNDPYTTEAVINAITHAKNHGARVINMSFGSWEDQTGKYGPDDPALETTINAAYSAGLVLVATAGNAPINKKRYPAAYDNVIAVSATDYNSYTVPNEYRAGFSNYGSWVDVAAPELVNDFGTPHVRI